MRQELLKSYLLALLAEGAFKSPGEILTKAPLLFAADLPAAALEIGGIALAHGVSSIAGKANDFILKKMLDITHKAKTKGVAALWDELKETYLRGLETVAHKKR